MVCLNTAYGQAAGIVSYLVSDLQGFLTTKPALTKSFRKKANEAWFYPPPNNKKNWDGWLESPPRMKMWCISYGKWWFSNVVMLVFQGCNLIILFSSIDTFWPTKRMVKPMVGASKKKGWWWPKCQTSPIPPPQKNKKIPTKVGTSSSWGISGCSAQSAPWLSKVEVFGASFVPLVGGNQNSSNAQELKQRPLKQNSLPVYHGFLLIVSKPLLPHFLSRRPAGPNLLFENSLHRPLRTVKLLGKNVSGTFLGWKKIPFENWGETGEIFVGMDE